MYRLRRDYNGHAEGTILHMAMGGYGLAFDEFRLTGIPHVLVSLCKTGYPHFTIPEYYLEQA